MGLLSKKKKRGIPEISMASTSDIAFLLLIFFIVSTVFNLERGLPMVLPSGQTESAAKVSRKNILEVKAHADNSITVKGMPVKVKDIRKLVQEAQDENPKLIVVIETSPHADYGVMVDVLDELKLARIRKISLKMGKS
ncbi:MAG: biopolymer transporter ExbD [Candidatus Krumholzibacteria bacterium]|jgi:biopolymer transport protein ExbD|nr:biopolymer transporter ExbD [Candidatus Krumholzibacteria bacterium]MDP6669611.1 biopolymer transporter ExbD [Candidatus Krumholzibacteria bacterium]MDP6797021.1 biopolymer transporter ExbD [Candidatus Krumholzibacteria bacterium]MDP7021175.1 biopolymer transporter ExbD [Candidatus Krumholzibacteria bacterium]